MWTRKRQREHDGDGSMDVTSKRERANMEPKEDKTMPMPSSLDSGDSDASLVGGEGVKWWRLQYGKRLFYADSQKLKRNCQYFADFKAEQEEASTGKEEQKGPPVKLADGEEDSEDEDELGPSDQVGESCESQDVAHAARPFELHLRLPSLLAQEKQFALFLRIVHDPWELCAHSMTLLDQLCLYDLGGLLWS